MEYTLFNGRLYPFGSIPLGQENRGLMYGDGFFETIQYNQGRILLFDGHFRRIRQAFDLLKFDKQSVPEQDSLAKEIHLICHINGCFDARIKLVFWREDGGIYLPEKHGTNRWLMAKSWTPRNNIISKSGFCGSVLNFSDKLSRIKLLSAAHYVTAGLEMYAQNWDEIIIKDQKGHISEGLYSNIFCESDGVFHTPPLETGCIAGVMREAVINELKKMNLQIHETPFDETFLLGSQVIYFCNVGGIRVWERSGSIAEKKGLTFAKKLEKLIWVNFV